MLTSSPRRLRRVLLATALVFSSAAAATTIATPVSAAPVGGDAALAVTKSTFVRGETVTAKVTIATKAKTRRATGTVDFVVDDGTPITVAVNGAGQAIYSTSTLPLGMHAISAVYNGDALYEADDAGRVSVAIVKGSTTTTAKSLRNPVATRTRAWLTADVARVGAAKGSLAGTANFLANDGEGNTVSASASVSSSGYAYWQPLLPDGTYVVTATYTGNDDFRPSTASAPVTIVVGSRPTIIHTDRAAFEAASTRLVTEDFEDADFSSLPTCSKTVDASTNDACFNPGQIVAGLTITNFHVGSGGQTMGAPSGDPMGNGTNYIYDNTWTGPFELALAGGRTAAAFDLVRYTGGSGSNCTVTAYGAGDAVVATTTVTCPDATDVFVGFTSQTPIERLTITGSSQPYAQGLDNISLGSVK